MRKLLQTTAVLAGLTMGASSVSALDLSNMSEAERQAFQQEIRAYLLENPEVIFEAVEVFEARQQQAQAANDETLVAQNAAAIFDDGYSWVGGNPDGDITLVEFLDYRCGYCRRAMPEVASLLKSDGNIRLIIKEMPILGEDSVIMSRFAIATRHVAGDDAYKAAHDALMGFNGKPTDVSLGRLAGQLGLDGDAILAKMNAEEVSNELRQTQQLAQKLQITGTPTFVLETELLRGFLPADQMAILVDQIRQDS